MVREKEKLKNMEEDFDTILQEQVDKKLLELEKIKKDNDDMEETLTKLQQDFKVQTILLKNTSDTLIYVSPCLLIYKIWSLQWNLSLCKQIKKRISELKKSTVSHIKSFMHERIRGASPKIESVVFLSSGS